MTSRLLHFTAETLFEKLKHIKSDNPLCSYTFERCERLTPLINDILELKAEKNAIILAHSYVHSDIVYGVADHVGDSYGLAKQAMSAEADTIVFPAVRFMAETAKILNPGKIVIDPNPNGGCSLADSITHEEVLRLRDTYPNHTFVCYINTTAAVKAACDVCVTSTNVYDIIKAIPNDKIYFLPDKLMAQNIRNYLKQNDIDKELLFYTGTCYVHEEFQAEHIDLVRQSHPNVTVIAHPECKPAVVNKADLVDSTTGMLNYVKNNFNPHRTFLILTECGITSRLQAECPGVNIVGTCMMCKYMKSNSLESIKQSLIDPLPSQIIEIEPEIQKRALNALKAMFFYYKN